ncbi:phytanoyl-CoA dioxygenase family protein [Nisaea acidiphila]|uniref:Phytanoyl-CoA dioxygenase family protein n=1 Tax=Nisaea acidiphila TaxID=1862145 RepID=A0A9J7AX59_9PROT|nr:phytanoyl-CoA dioxygenase family protein [Nisaea acidiphila]UUX51710.1 phytanoyl-CoA dioxygenase family protein [Nisaea acidiphila]
MLTKDQVARYHEDGYVIPDFRLSTDKLERIKQLHGALLERHPEFKDYCNALLDYEPAFREFAEDPEILDMISQVIGSDLALWNMSFFAKPAHGGKRTPWHQDGEYWPIRPLATCTVWLAVDAATPENGCLKFIRGSHKDQRLKAHNRTDATDVTLNQELDPAAYNEDEAVDLVLEPGQISLHDVYLLHGSEANHSDKPRRGMTMRFMPTTSHFDRDLAKRKAETQKIRDQSKQKLFLMRGVDRTGRNLFEDA